jgi:hypothetical protein
MTFLKDIDGQQAKFGGAVQRAWMIRRINPFSL